MAMQRSPKPQIGVRFLGQVPSDEPRLPHGRLFSYRKSPRTEHEPRPHGHGKEGTVAEDNAAPERDYKAHNGTAKDLLAKSPTDG